METNNELNLIARRTRRLAHAFIYAHPRRDEFLDWLDEHEQVVDDLKLVVENMTAEGSPPVENAAVLQTVRLGFKDIPEEWAPLFATLLLYEFPELRRHLTHRVWKDTLVDSGEKDEQPRSLDVRPGQPSEDREGPGA